ncbi:MAG TPA: hypothetical protein VF480_10925 [Verrucomicrobiae bacterium]
MSGGLGLVFHRAFGFRVHVAVAVSAALSLHAVAVFTALSFHVLARRTLFFGLRVHALGLIALHVVLLGGFFLADRTLFLGLGPRAFWLLALHVVFLGRFFAPGVAFHVFLRVLLHAGRGLHFFLGPRCTFSRCVIAIHRSGGGCGVFGGRCTVFRSGSLRIGESGSGDQRRRSHRYHQAISHSNISSRVCIARADNERRCAMFRDASGSIGFVF